MAFALDASHSVVVCVCLASHRGATARPLEAGTVGPGRPGRRSIVGLVVIARPPPASSRRRLSIDGWDDECWDAARCGDASIELAGTARLTPPPIPLHRRIARSRRSTHSQVNRIGGAAGWCVSRPGVPRSTHTTPNPTTPKHSILIESPPPPNDTSRSWRTRTRCWAWR